MAGSLRRLCAGLLVATTATVVSVVALPPTPGRAAVSSGAVFNDPRPGPGQRRIFEHLEGLINGARIGSSIHMTVFHFDDAFIAAKLVTARNRGVFVQVVLDSQSALNGPTETLIHAFGTDRTRASWVHLCSREAACIGNRENSTPINHNKFFLFSNTSGAQNVVVQSSSNLNDNNATMHWNNAVTLVDNWGIYSKYLEYFDDLAWERKTSDYYRYTTSGNAKVYFFPRAGTDKSTDTIYNILDENVDCEGNTTVGTADTHRTIIRVAMWYFSRGAIARKLRDLADRKCWVEVIYQFLDDGVLADLSGHDRIVLHKLALPYDVHSKYMLIEGKYDGRINTKLVFTGSHNYSNAALRDNDEALLRIQDDAIHDQYRANFRLMRSTVG